LAHFLQHGDGELKAQRRAERRRDSDPGLSLFRMKDALVAGVEPSADQRGEQTEHEGSEKRTSRGSRALGDFAGFPTLVRSLGLANGRP
jgi:hypothetical protein